MQSPKVKRVTNVVTPGSGQEEEDYGCDATLDIDITTKGVVNEVTGKSSSGYKQDNIIIVDMAHSR